MTDADRPDPHALPIDQLGPWLRLHVKNCDGQLSVEKFPGGQSNPTYALRFDQQTRYVLRRKPSGALLPSAHAVDREYRVTKALAGTAVPVAKVHALCLDESVIGSVFYVMDYVEGRNFWDPRLPELQGAERGAIYTQMNEVIAALHCVDVEAVGLSDFGRPGNYFERQIGRWSKQYRATETERFDAMEALLAWLPAHIPASLGDEVALVHGDYRLDNLIFAKAEPAIRAVIDWELATLGHPLADLAYHVMSWRLSQSEFRGLAGADLAQLQIPNETQYIESYLRRTNRAGIEPAAWEFAIAYNLFRVACIRQGIFKRALAGNASSEHALAAGARARDMAEAAWRQAQAVN